MTAPDYGDGWAAEVRLYRESSYARRLAAELAIKLNAVKKRLGEQ